MSGASLLALLDDIATLLDDVALMTKAAAQKTAGVLGDDLALNAQQVAGVRAERELPVVWAVAKGSFLNKAILIPAALFISAIFPKAIIPLLMLGGLYLCFEGVEKVAHPLKQRLRPPIPEQTGHEQALEALADPAVDLDTFEKARIKGAIRTDFVLSTEIIVITLGMVAKLGLIEQLCVLVAVGALMTAGVYGVVAGIVKLDDLGACLYRKNSPAGKKIGKALLLLAPRLMGFLSIVGTLAMFMVGGGIITEHITNLHHLAEQIAASVGPAGFLGEILVHVVVGFIAGTVALGAWTLINRLKKRARG